jgi:hypothetical protein
VLAVLVTWPVAIRPWALPVVVAWYRDPEWDQAHGTRPQTPAPRARLRLARVGRWFPERQFILVGDAGDGPSETARFGHRYGPHLTVVRKFDGDAALDAPPPPRTPRPRGRPRVQGRKLASPQAVVAKTAQRPRLPVAWEGGRTRDREVITGTGPWYRIGEDLVEVRGVHVHECPGTPRDEACLTTEIPLRPQQSVEYDTQRGASETTFQEWREDLTRESPTGYGQAPV